MAGGKQWKDWGSMFESQKAMLLMPSKAKN